MLDKWGSPRLIGEWMMPDYRSKQTNSSLEMNAVVSLALIESRVEDGKRDNDRLGMFMPLITDALQGLEGTRFGVADVQNRVQNTSGLKLPHAVVSTLLTRAARRGFVRRNQSKYERTNKKLPYSDVTAERRRIEDDYSHLVEGFRAYAERKGIPELNVDDARRLLSEYFDTHFRSLSERKLPDPEIDVSSDDTLTIDSRIVGRYLYEAINNDKKILDTAVTQVRGRIVYDAAFLPGFSEGEQRLSGLVCYLDSPVICRALGYGTVEDKYVTSEAISTLKKAGVSCQVFDVTVNEMQQVLGNIYNNWGNPREDEPPDSFLYCMPRKYDRGYVFRVSSDPETEIRSKLGLRVVSTPARVESLVHNEKALAERLQRRDGRNDEGRVWHDVNCVAAVLTTRRGVYANSIGKAKAFFVSQSYLTIRNVGKWWQEDEHRRDIPPIFSLVSLANYAWLYDNSSMTRSIAKESLVAACAASMMPSEQSWKAFARKLTEYVDEGKLDPQTAMDYMYSMDARAVVSEMGEITDDVLPSDDSMNTILEEVDKRLGTRAYGKKIEEYDRQLEELSLTNETLAKTVAQGQEETSIQRQRADNTERTLEKERRRLENRVIAKATKRTNQLTIALAVLSCCIGIVLFFWQIQQGTSTDHPMFVVTFLAAIPSVLSFIPPIRAKIHAKFEKRYRREWIES